MKNRPSSETTAATGSSDAPAAGTLMAAAAPHSLPTNHRPVSWARDFYLGSDGARTTYFRLGSNGGRPAFCSACAPPPRHVAGAEAAPGSSGRRRVPPLGCTGGGGGGEGERERRSCVPAVPGPCPAGKGRAATGERGGVVAVETGLAPLLRAPDWGGGSVGPGGP